MGRADHHRIDLQREEIELHLQYIPFVDGDYDEGGAYWGSPANLYRAVNVEHGVEMFVRANWRKDAEDKVKLIYRKATFVALTENDLSDFAKGYIECALWCHQEFEGASVAKTSYPAILADCWDFQKANEELLKQSGLTEEQQGHDFWLTRNGHGSGFWDRGLGEVGDKLTQACKVFTGRDLWLDIDGDVNGW